MPSRLALPVTRRSRYNDGYVPLTGVQLDDVDTTAVDVGLALMQGANPSPIIVWTAWPGPKTPSTPGRYLVVIRVTGGGVADEVGYLIVT